MKGGQHCWKDPLWHGRNLAILSLCRILARLYIFLIRFSDVGGVPGQDLKKAGKFPPQSAGSPNPRLREYSLDSC